jgi:2-polyprenyl-3-methyl-5-hydroxy-6-metoxy-1,4-benzoquinol methylase
MSTPQVYFKNHSRATRFPWSLYHRPLFTSLVNFLKSKTVDGKKILVIGPGELQEIELLIQLGFELSILDIDPRVIDHLRQKYPTYISQAFLVDDHFNNYPEHESFDIIYAKEVIEHFEEPRRFFAKIYEVLKKGGRLWVSTPNYGFFLLPLIEITILEFIARISGFSRKHIHPTKYSFTKLQKDLTESGFKDLTINQTQFKLALVATAFKK